MIDPRPSDIFSAGQVLNNTYEIRGVLGRGGTGEVYLAHNQIADRTIAIKALNAQFSGNEDFLELMKREEQMRAITHDAVVRYSEISRSDAGHVFLVMDYVEGPSLNDEMARRRLSDRELMIVAHRVLEGLEATHAQGIVHRDLSPDNIILRGGEAARATIIDFGIAKDTATGARTIVGNEFAGKYEYAAPEQLDGRAEYRTDLYCLGASLLAAARQETPDMGSAPAEIIRRKSGPLDTSGLDEPLKSLIDWLCAPDPANRPADARAALVWLDAQLKPQTARQSGTAAPTRAARRRRRRTLVVAGVVAIAGGLVWASGVLAPLFAPALPRAAPWELSARFDPGGLALLTGHAPDEATAEALTTAFTQAADRVPETLDITLAQGMPRDDWPDLAAELMALAGMLQSWDLHLSDLSANLSGLAASRADREALQTRLTDWTSLAGMPVSTEITAGPETLDFDTVQAQLAPLATCGALEQLDGPGTEYALFDTITVTGDVANAGDADRIRDRLMPEIGDRSLRVETTTLNDDLCAIRAALPPASSQALSIWLGHGSTGQPALAGVFRTGQNPVVEVQMPATITDASLWVMVVDNTGKVFHVLPNINRTDHAVADLGEEANGLRRIRVLWAIDQLQEDPSRLAIKVTPENFGKSEVVAILTRTPLFDIRRPREESVASVAEALTDTLAGREDQVLAVASRIIDARQ